MNRRIGKILIAMPYILEQPEVAKKILKDMIVVRAEQLFEHNAIEYVAISDHFDEVPQGDRAPNYQIEEVDGEIKFNRWIDG